MCIVAENCMQSHPRLAVFKLCTACMSSLSTTERLDIKSYCTADAESVGGRQGVFQITSMKVLQGRVRVALRSGSVLFAVSQLKITIATCCTYRVARLYRRSGELLNDARLCITSTQVLSGPSSGDFTRVHIGHPKAVYMSRG